MLFFGAMNTKIIQIPQGPTGQNIINKAASEARKTRQDVVLHGYSMARHQLPTDVEVGFVDLAIHGESRIVIRCPRA
jgi:hypothetical protein